MKQLLSGQNIIKSYGVGGEKHRVLNGVSVTIGSGEFVSIMGPSGSGKSTLLYALSGMDGIDGGEVSFEGRKLSGLSDDALSDLRRSRMGFVFQQPALLKNLNLLDNIILPQMDITQASGGQLQRAGICRALMSEPEIVFGDEPTGALNTKTAKEIMELFTKINRDGIAILLVTHDPNIAARTERVLFLCDGEIIDECRLSKFTERDFDNRVGEITKRMQKIGI